MSEQSEFKLEDKRYWLLVNSKLTEKDWEKDGQGGGLITALDRGEGVGGDHPSSSGG